VTLVNRSAAAGARSAQALGLAFCPLEHFRAADFAIVVQATPVGQRGEAAPFSLEGMAAGGLFYDFVVPQGEEETALVRQARHLGLVTLSGTDILDIQARRQFQLICGKEMS
jgi:shikimate 5-dehydrogenase